MIQENELITLLIGTGGLIFILVNVRALARAVPSWRWFFTAFLFLYAGWCLTVLEGFFLPEKLNIVEHGAYMVSSLLTGVWAIRVLVLQREESL